MKYLKHKLTGKIVVEIVSGEQAYYRAKGSHNMVEFIPAWVIAGSADWVEFKPAKCELCGRAQNPEDNRACICLRWEITAFRDKTTGFVIPKTRENWYEGSNGETNYSGLAKAYIEAEHGRYEIYSVKRFRDNAEFSIGNKVYIDGDIDTIVGFHSENDKCWFKLSNPDFGEPNILDDQVKELVSVIMPKQFLIVVI